MVSTGRSLERAPVAASRALPIVPARSSPSPSHRYAAPLGLVPLDGHTIALVIGALAITVAGAEIWSRHTARGHDAT